MSSSREIAQLRPFPSTTRTPPWTCSIAVYALILLGPVCAGAEPTNPVDEEDTNPLEPVLQKIGADWGVVVDAQRIAFNPLKGTVVLRQFSIESKLQGRFLLIPRIAVKVDWDAGQVDHATIEGGNLSVDITKLLGIKQQQGEKSLGFFRKTTLQASTVLLKANGVDLLRLKEVSGHATSLGIKSVGKRLEAQGTLSVSKGEAVLTDGALRVTRLKLKGTFKGRRLEIHSMSGKSGGGTVQCHGAIPLDTPKSGVHKALRCHLDHVRLVRGDFLDVTVSGDISLTKQPKQYRLSGALDVDSGTKIQPQRWGPRRGEQVPFAVDVSLRLKTKSGRATAKLVGSASSGRVDVVGRNKRRSVRMIEELLKQLSSTSATANGASEE